MNENSPKAALRLRLLAAASLATALYAVLLLGSRFADPPIVLALLVIFCFSCLAVLAVEMSREPFDPFSPIIFITGLYFVEFVIRNAVYLYDGEPAQFYDDAVHRGKYATALAAGLFSYLILLGGYYCPRLPDGLSRRFPTLLPRGANVSPRAFFPVMFLVFALGILGWKFRFDYFGGFSEYLGSFMRVRFILIEDSAESARFALWTIARDVMSLVVPLGYVFLFRRSRSFLLKGAWIILYAATLLFAILTGFRNVVLMVIMGVFLLHHYLVRPFSQRAVLAIYAGGLSCVALFTYLQSRLYTLIAGWEELGWTYAFKGILKTAVTFDALWGICSTFPDRVPYLKGATFIDMFLAFVPRFLWEAKKEFYGNSEITMLMGLPTNFQLSTSIPGELLANFGPAGIGGMFLYGILFRAIDLAKKRDSGWAMAYSVFLSARWIPIFWMGFTALATTAYSLIPFILLLKLLDRLPRMDGDVP